MLFLLSLCVLYVLVHVNILKVKVVKVGTNRSSSLPQQTLLLKRLVCSPTFNSVTLLNLLAEFVPSD